MPLSIAAVVAKEIEECQSRTDKAHGYRRVWKWLRGRNTQRTPKTVRRIMKKENVTAELQRHSGQGFQYTSQAYFKLTQSYGITPSMSRKGNPYDNAMAENIFHRGFLYCPHNLGRFSPHRGFCRLSKKSVTAKIRCLFSITDTESHPDLDRWKPSEWVRRSAPQ